MPTPSVLAVLADAPIEIDRDTAREAALRELSDPIYAEAEPSLWERIVTWIVDRLEQLLTTAGSLPGGYTWLVVFVVLLVLIAIAIRLRVGKLARTGRARREVFDARTRTAAEHRAAAERALAEGDTATAIVERFRAIARELEQRAVLEPQTGRTADELATQAAAALPDTADDLRAAARIFDDVYYGGHPAAVEQYRELARVDDSVRTQRLMTAEERP